MFHLIPFLIKEKVGKGLMFITFKNVDKKEERERDNWFLVLAGKQYSHNPRIWWPPRHQHSAFIQPSSGRQLKGKVSHFLNTNQKSVARGGLTASRMSYRACDLAMRSMGGAMSRWQCKQLSIVSQP